MSTPLGTIQSHVGVPFAVSQFCGPESLVSWVGSRLCIQLGDDLQLDLDAATALWDVLGKYIHEAHGERKQAREDREFEDKVRKAVGKVLVETLDEALKRHEARKAEES